MTRETRTERSRNLRQRQTRAEDVFWKAVRGHRLDGLKFRRQHPVAGYFADFACEQAMLVVELDGGVHERDEQMTYDYLRQQDIEALGWSVLRFTNADVLNDLPAVLAAVKAQARLAGAATPHPPADVVGGPLPLPLGEG